MKFELVSDLHLDSIRGSEKKKLSYLEEIFSEPKAETLLIAGDIADSLARPSSFVKQFFDLISERYSRLYAVLGNHDYMDKEVPFEKTVDFVREAFPRIRWLDNEFIAFEDGFLYGAAFWSHINPEISDIIEAYMPDYKRIFNSSGEAISSIDTSLINIECGAKLIDWAARHPNEKITVLTHHAPSYLSSAYSDNVTTAAFCNHLDRFLEDNPNISCWVHGHVHAPVNYFLGLTNVICHPHGYFKSERAKDQPYRPLLIER